MAETHQTTGGGDRIRDEGHQVDFSSMVLGFSSAALYFLGHCPVEGKVPQEKNLVLARQNIDFILLLKEKTRGNLSETEDRLITQILSDLQLKFIEASR